MADVLDAMASYVMNLIVNMVEEEWHMQWGFSSEIMKLEEKMKILQYFIADAEKRRITEYSVQRWVMRLKEAMYDTADILDLCQLNKAGDRKKFKDASWWRNLVPGSIQSIRFAHQIVSQIKEINQRLHEIHRDAENFNLKINLGSNLEQRKLTDAKMYRQNTTSEFVESAIVGEMIKKDAKELVQVLTTDDNRHNIMVVSIVGMGGIGKTTLAQKIFHEAAIEGHFNTRIWLTITQCFDEIDLLRSAIRHAGGSTPSEEQNMSLLTRTLTDVLSKGRFLLVMDDVWSDEAWNHVLFTPIINASRNQQQGNRVLITTRLEDQARRMRTYFHQHHVSLLEEVDAWSLLKKQLPPTPNPVLGSDDLKHEEDVGMKIIRKCGGLPLAIKVMGGLLSTREQSEREWEAVLNHDAWSRAGLPMELDSRIYLSYEDLSPPLKQCFLYCSLFPKGIIRQSIIIPMWISEGFIQPQDRSNSYDDREAVATEYYWELVTRNLIEPTTESSITAYEFTVHDVLRSFAEFMAREESLVIQNEQAVVGNTHSLVRRLSIGSTQSVREWHTLPKQVRMLIINPRINIRPDDTLSSLSSLRVLLIKGADCDRLIDSLCHLRHLRYLHLEDTNISRLPDDIHRMQLLEHIVVLDSEKLENLPSSIIELVHLRTLNISGCNVKTVPKGFGGLTNLQTLSGFPHIMDMHGGGGWCSLEELRSLSQLRNLTVNDLNVSATDTSWAEKAMISNKGHLSYLKLECNCSMYMGLTDEMEKQDLQRAVEEVFQKLRPPTCIEHFLIGKGGYFGCQLPSWMMASATTATFKSLRILTLKGLLCCTQLPDGLCQLPCLASLQALDAPAIRRVGPEFQASSSTLVVGGGVAPTSAAFPKLTNLYLRRWSEWEEWDWEEDVTSDAMAMPALKMVTICNCKLSHLPPGLANSNRHALRELYLYDFTSLTSLDDFPSVVELDVFRCPELRRISGLSRLQKIRIKTCPNLEVLEAVPVLDSLNLTNTTSETLPGYLRGVNPRHEAQAQCMCVIRCHIDRSVEDA
ncbi:unnamed protein product [Urochloa decumbens]|uniref:Uncharacterized protein n=1 Tax=Urochloa decumbens TaxID=240449 RepID=A0ABC9AHV6_9POAL